MAPHQRLWSTEHCFAGGGEIWRRIASDHARTGGGLEVFGMDDKRGLLYDLCYGAARKPPELGKPSQPFFRALRSLPGNKGQRWGRFYLLETVKRMRDCVATVSSEPSPPTGVVKRKFELAAGSISGTPS
ncbi:hypothetical protein LCI18_001708 [Fusarium solani-melongenae]|uniref:Uncharacterized protein n=1 Tax=Fusarium solani subsp. cucurbitae TaxID=2747967 RepID=A0ACD3YPC7_FUSSC|nr:hypothetical protein LCI18_001708 [Fusarium solani-melongenae]